MRKVRVCFPCLLGFAPLRHNTTSFELEFWLAFRAVSNARKHYAKIAKFQMRVPNIVSRHFPWRTGKTEALMYKSWLAISMDAKKRTERKKSLIWLADQTSCRLSSHKLKNTSNLKPFRLSWYKFRNFLMPIFNYEEDDLALFRAIERLLICFQAWSSEILL